MLQAHFAMHESQHLLKSAVSQLLVLEESTQIMESWHGCAARSWFTSATCCFFDSQFKIHVFLVSSFLLLK